MLPHKLTVGATAVPHAELLEFVKPALAKQGVELEIKVFTDYVQPNVRKWQRSAWMPISSSTNLIWMNLTRARAPVWFRSRAHVEVTPPTARR